MQFDAIVLGGGAAGLMCAITAGRRGRKVAILEHGPKIGRKILISGGGRCNFTNVYTSAENFLGSDKRFHKPALAAYPPSRFVELLQKHRIAFHEKTHGQLFCDGSAREIVALLESECGEAGVQIFLNKKVLSLNHSDDFKIEASDGSVFSSRCLVIATGGLSIPKLGATPFGYDVARQFGIAIVPPRPALVPLLFAGDDREGFSSLAGVSATVRAGFDSHSFDGKMLFTHRGISGPAVLQISSYWNRDAESNTDPITIDLAPSHEIVAPLLQTAARTQTGLSSSLRTALPTRLADAWLKRHPPASLSNASLKQFEHTLHQWRFCPAGTEGFEKAEVTVGGVSTDALSAKTMECRHVPGLFFIGEVVDITGQLGGFNFQWAWASGFAAGSAI